MRGLGFTGYQSSLLLSVKQSKKKTRLLTLVAMQHQYLSVSHQQFLLLIAQISSSLQPQAQRELEEARKSI
jgi:hypothetical protein